MHAAMLGAHLWRDELNVLESSLAALSRAQIFPRGCVASAPYQGHKIHGTFLLGRFWTEHGHELNAGSRNLAFAFFDLSVFSLLVMLRRPVLANLATHRKVRAHYHIEEDGRGRRVTNEALWAEMFTLFAMFSSRTTPLVKERASERPWLAFIGTPSERVKAEWSKSQAQKFREYLLHYKLIKIF